MTRATQQDRNSNVKLTQPAGCRVGRVSGVIGLTATLANAPRLASCIAVMSAIQRISNANEHRYSHPPAETCRAALDRYFRGCDRHDSEVLRSTFHPTTVLRTVDAYEALERLTQIEWWAIVEASTSCAVRRRQRELDRTHHLALVEAEALWPTHQVNDLLLVARDWIGWTIVGCVSHRSPAGSRARVDADEVAAIREFLHEAYTSLDDRRAMLVKYAPDCRFITTGPRELAVETLSEVAARRLRDAEEQPRSSPISLEMNVTLRETAAAAQISYFVDERRCVDMLLLLKSHGTWRIVDVLANGVRA